MSKIDLHAGRETTRRELDGGTSMPRGVHLASGGGHLLVAGGRKAAPGSSALWVLDPETLEIQARVSGVGNETYFLTGG